MVSIMSRTNVSRLVLRFYSSVPNPIRLDKEKQKLITDKFSSLRDKYEAPKYPIVLCHGFSGFDQLTVLPRHERTEKMIFSSGLLKLDYWYGIKEALEKIGSTVLIAKVPAFGTISERAADLNSFIDKQCEKLRDVSKEEIYNKKNSSDATFKEEGSRIKINLIAHSMGGLDSRYLISKLSHPNYQIVSLTTVSTPHHGSECADFLMDMLDNRKFLQRMCPQSVSELTTDALKEFNEKVPNDPKVSYFSYGARFRPHWYNVFKLTWEIMKIRLLAKSKKQKHLVPLDNDGIVTVESSKWGEYLGTLDEVDHLDLINWTNRTRTAVDRAVFRKEPKFNAIALYLDIADNLRKRGF